MDEVLVSDRTWEVALLDLSFGHDVDDDLGSTVAAYRRRAGGLG